MSVKEVYILSQYSQEPSYCTTYRHYNWAKLLIKRGYSVTIFCASATHNASTNIITKNKLWVESDFEGIHYVYVKTHQYTGNGLKRIRNIFEYILRLPKVLKSFGRPDVIIATNPTPLTGCVGIKFAKKWGIPCICEILDLWPQSIIDIMGFSESNPIIQMLFKLEKYIYKKAESLIFSMEGGEQYLKERKLDKCIDMNKVYHINMGVDIAMFDQNSKEQALNDPLLLNSNLFKAVYCGSVRKANNIKLICDGAKIIQDKGYKNTIFMIHGYGEDLEELKQYCSCNHIQNVHFYGRISKENIPYLLTHADINILCFQEATISRYGSSQSKLFEYLASGKPILCAVNFGYNLIERFHCGYVTYEQSAQAFAEGFLTLYHSTAEQRQEMSSNSRKTAELYDQPLLVDELEKIFKACGILEN